MSSVGRPPEVDSEGRTVQKCLVNVTIPTKLANFLKEKGINRSELFRDCVTKLFNHEICNKCYGDLIQETKMGWYCRDCNASPIGELVHVGLKNCENCESKYAPPYNMFAQRKDKKVLSGCYDCIPPKERQ